MFCLVPNKRNYSQTARNVDTIKYIVVHYTGNNGDTARNNLRYFFNNTPIASAHFFVDETEVCSSVPVGFAAYHCGATPNAYKHPDCRNDNSIGVELCSRLSGGKYYFKPETERNAAEFIASLMVKYNIPLANVIRHYDVTGKNCPAPYVDQAEWQRFKNMIVSNMSNKTDTKEESSMVYYESIDQIPAGEMRDTIQKLVDRGTIKGNGSGLHLSADMVRMFVFLKREGLLK